MNNQCNVSLETIFYLFLNFRKSCNLRKVHSFLICIYFGLRYAMNSCDTAIESLRYKLFEDKHFGYHHGTQWVLTSHDVVPSSHYSHVYITSIMSVWGILGTMIVPKNIFVWKSDIQAFRIWIKNYFINSGWVLPLTFIWKCMIFFRIQAFWLKVSFYM